MVDDTQKNAKILIVDDKESNVDMLVYFLINLGYTNLQTTTDSRLVESLYQSFSPDIILLDLLMPHLNGFEVMEQLKALVPSGSYFPILVLTADITLETRQRALAAGAMDFLTKPFDLTELQLRINNLLVTRYLHLQLANQNQVLAQKVKERTHDLMREKAKLVKANHELIHLDKAKNEFLMLISHEIRTPLNGIMGFSSILKEEIRTPELLDYIQWMCESAQRLEKFSLQALLITELRMRKRIINKKDVSLAKITENAIGFCNDKILEKNISLDLLSDPALISMNGDQELLQLCFDKLIDNAVRYSPVDKNVTVRIFAKGRSTVCEFQDNGPGFPEKILQNPISLFSLGNGHQDQHTGLNLALVSLIMHALKGRMEISNSPEGGALVRLTFTQQR